MERLSLIVVLSAQWAGKFKHEKGRSTAAAVSSSKATARHPIMASWQKWQGEWWSQDNWGSWHKAENDEKKTKGDKKKTRDSDAAANEEVGASPDAGARPQSSRKAGDHSRQARNTDDENDYHGEEQQESLELNSKWSQWAGGSSKKNDGEKTHRKRDFQSLQRLAGRKAARLEDELKAAKDNVAALEASMEELKSEMTTQQEESAKQQEESAKKVEDMKAELTNVRKECEEELHSMRIILGKKSHSEEDMKRNVLTQTDLLKASEDQRLQMQKIMDRQAMKIHKHEQALPFWQRKVKQLRKRLEDAEKVINRSRHEKALAED